MRLRLSSLYFSLVSRIFQDTALSWPEILRIIDGCEAEGNEYRTTATVLPFPKGWVPAECLVYFGQVQEGVVLSLVRVWKGAQLAVGLAPFSYPNRVLDPGLRDDPLTRTAALCSLVSAIMSHPFGVLYIVRFDNTRIPLGTGTLSPQLPLTFVNRKRKR